MRIVGNGAVALVVLLGVGSGACSSDKAGTPATTTAPEDLRTSDANVAKGLADITATAVAVAASAGTDKAKAQTLIEDIEPAWQPVEGTVKSNDQDTYLAFEDAFAALEAAAKDGDAAKASSAARDITNATAGYVKKHPG